MSSLRAIVVFPLDLLLSYRRTSSSHLSCPAGKSCSLHRSGTKTCRKRALVGFPPRRGAQRRTNRLDASRRDGAAPRSTSKLSLFCQRQKCNMNLFALLLKIFNCFCTHRSKLSIKCFVRDDVVLIFHAFDHWPESWAISSNQKPRRLPEPLSERWRFSFERWKFTKAIDVDKLCRSFDRGFALKNHCLNCLSNRSRNLRQPGEPACLNCRFSAVNLEILWFKACCCPCNVFIIWTNCSTVAIWLGIDGRESCNCSNSFHNERSWEHKRMYCELFQHLLRQIPICHQFLTLQQYKILPSHQTTLVYEPKCCATMMCFLWHTDTILESKQP